LIIALTNNSRLKELKLGWNPHATAAGWVAFLTILQTPNSALEVLHLQQNSIIDHVQISFANALANNSIGVANDVVILDSSFFADVDVVFQCHKPSLEHDILHLHQGS
jgi:hypothetical protein